MTTSIPIELVGPAGEPFGRLRSGAPEVIAEAENRARANNISKQTALSQVLREHLEGAGYRIEEPSFADALRLVEVIRKGGQVRTVPVVVRAPSGGVPVESDSKLVRGPWRGKDNMTARQETSTAIKFFESERIYPNPEAQAWYERLVGLDDHKSRLLRELEMVLYPDHLEAWSSRHHGRVLRVCEVLRDRAPLVLLEGDVGCGKTALAETIGDALARLVGKRSHVHLLKMNTQVRGSGHVGEMSDLIVQAFTQAEARADALGGEPVLLLLDEADALAARRDNQHMHHEDKAGLNTLLQRIDNLRLSRRRMAVIFITNRPDALDPAIQRRAALRLTFGRPGDEVRAEIIKSSLPELHLSSDQVNELVNLTGPKAKKNHGVTFTASDITERLLPAALRDAYSGDRKLLAEDLLRHAHDLLPTPEMGTA
jgi:SpoVK/Ycf46/Vps4 family AAA+-type ATPase